MSFANGVIAEISSQNSILSFSIPTPSTSSSPISIKTNRPIVTGLQITAPTLGSPCLAKFVHNATIFSTSWYSTLDSSGGGKSFV